MCYRLSIDQKRVKLQERFDALFDDGYHYTPLHHVSAFGFPEVPVITDELLEKIQNLSWGLIPHWARDEEQARQLRMQTFNARAETVHEKPSFRHAIRAQRCLVLADGFYEWHHFQGKKYPYHIRLKDREPFALAGLWDRWEGPAGMEYGTFVITTEANPLMERIHNTKKRMPVILLREDERAWLRRDLDRDGITAMLVPYDQDGMEAYTVSRFIGQKGRVTNVPGARERVEYDELNITRLEDWF